MHFKNKWPRNNQYEAVHFNNNSGYITHLLFSFYSLFCFSRKSLKCLCLNEMVLDIHFDGFKVADVFLHCFVFFRGLKFDHKEIHPVRYYVRDCTLQGHHWYCVEIVFRTGFIMDVDFWQMSLLCWWINWSKPVFILVCVLCSSDDASQS